MDHLLSKEKRVTNFTARVPVRKQFRAKHSVGFLPQMSRQRQLNLPPNGGGIPTRRKPPKRQTLIPAVVSRDFWYRDVLKFPHSGG